MTKLGGAMSVGLTLPIAAFGASAVKSSMDAESALANLEAVLASTGGVAGVTLDELTGNAAALQKITKFSDEAVMASQGMLLTFTNIGKDIFPDATMATLDMAEKFGMDASQAAITLGKALNDPVSGVTALRRIGVMLTDDQEAQIKSFMAVNDVASAQAIIMKELQVEIGGVAEAAGATTAGSFEQFKNQLDDMKETIGTALIPVLVRFMEAITPLIEKFAAMSPEMQNTIIAVIAVVAALGPIITIVGSIVTAIGAIAPVVSAIAGAVAAAAGPILIIAAAVAMLYLAWKTNFFGIRDTLTAVWESIKLIFAAFKAAFNGDWYQFGVLLRQAWDVIWNLIVQRVGNAWTAIVNAVKNIIAGVKAAFQIDWSELGKKIIDGIINGIKNGIGAVVNAVKNMVSAAKSAASGFLGIKSPSTVFQGYGNQMSSGLAKGMGSPVKPNSYSPASSKAGNNITINVTNPKGETSEESVRKTLKSLSYLGVVS